MIICQNCGTTNNEKINRVCRTCGALLPVPSKEVKTREQKAIKEKKKEKKPLKKPVKVPIDLEKKQEEKFELHEIPKETEKLDTPRELQEIPLTSDDEFESNLDKESESVGLQEIAPQPYKGSILDSRKKILSPIAPTKDVISDALSELKNSVLEKEEVKPSIPASTIPEKTPEEHTIILKQKQLEKDMTDVLSFLSKKISVKKLETPIVKPIKEEVHEEKIPPASMNEILNHLLTLDLNIEASAIIKTDGTILASAISSRISDSLFATVGMNLSMIGTDIIEGLDAGLLKSISVRGTAGVLDLAPIDRNNPSVKDMLLILFSHPSIKSGIIYMAVSIVKKQIKEYLGIEKKN